MKSQRVAINRTQARNIRVIVETTRRLASAHVPAEATCAIDNNAKAIDKKKGPRFALRIGIA